MQDNYKNIYRSARETAGLTQARWAEALGVSVEAVAQYEAGKIMPSDDVVTRMVEVSVLPALAYWHLRHKSTVAAQLLPAVECLPLPQAVIQLLVRMRDFHDHHRADHLMDIAADGRVDLLEEKILHEIVEELHGIIQAAMQVEYAERRRQTND